MVKQGSARRSSSRISKRMSHVSSFRELSLLERDRERPPAPGPEHHPAPSPPEPPVPLPSPGPSRVPDRVYLHAAAIFQNTHLQKAAAHRLISYGMRARGGTHWGTGEGAQREAYELAFNTLKYQELLEDIIIDSCFYLSQPLPEEMMSLVAVMLYDLQDRRFLPRELPANHAEEEIEPDVREVEECLLRFKTKLAASLARCRIKHDLLTIDSILPESVRLRQERASNLPVYAWINTLRTSMEEVCDVLSSAGFSRVHSEGRLEGRTFRLDTHCQDLLVFPACVRGDLYKNGLLSDYRLIIQDKSCCMVPWALRPLLDEDGGVLLAGSFSAATVAHMVAAVAAVSKNTQSVRVLVCVGERSPAETNELQELLSSMGCSDVKLLFESFNDVDVGDARLQKVRIVLLTPQCSLSAVSNPVDFLLQENGDTELLQDLSHGSVSRSRLETLVSQQRRDLQHALHFPKVRAVVYSTCSSFSEENEDVVRAALSLREQDGSKLQPFRLSPPALLQCSVSDEGQGDVKSCFFSLEASDQSNGCFIAVMTRQPEPEVKETPQEVISRAAAIGLLDGLQPDQPTKKQGRRRRTRKGAANQGGPAHRQARPSISSQSKVEEFLKNEEKASSSAPAVVQEQTNGAFSPWGDAKPTHQLSSKSVNLKLGSASSPALTFCPALTLSPTQPSNIIFTSSMNLPSSTTLTSSSTLTSSPSNKTLNRTVINAAFTNNRRASVPGAPPPAPPKGRQEVLRPVTVTFPPVLFPDSSPSSVWKSRKAPPPRLSHTLSYPQWRNHTPFITYNPLLHPPIHTQTHTPLHTQSNSSLRHPRPWL
ncbi:putative methyltransferase NSUN7 [Astyanax mexicanus]|uniref:Putative methyltransferase NSUN7 n=1 Tax=Astyanax mexicanus TaxID=7994 RepID=A0A8T2L3A0_ASTMX|nr:putative methyltransferase NSUN7 [Astyanax mexicanus]